MPSATARPTIREQAVRILGRDVSRVGTVVFNKPEAKKPFAAQAHLKALLPLATDPDAGVRRELILAFRWLPTAAVGEALKELTKGWDGRDRWYLEALGLALQDREGPYLSGLFDGTLFGPLALDAPARTVTSPSRRTSRPTGTRRISRPGPPSCPPPP